MNSETFVIKSILVQNSIMGIIAAILLILILRSIKKRSPKSITAVGAWTLIALWFFNSPLWGFSAVTVSQEGIELRYGALSVFKNSTLPVKTPWKIKVYQGGVRKLDTLYFLELANHRSIKVQDPEDLAVLQKIGRAINYLNSSPLGEVQPQPAE